MANVTVSVDSTGQMLITADGDGMNVVAVRPTGFEYALYASDESVAVGDGCRHADVGVFVCGPLLSSVTYLGGPGIDYVDLSEVALPVTASTAEGADLVEAGSAGSVLDGGPGRDSLLGGDGVDRADGGASDDLVIGGAGPDTLIGGGGGDLVEAGGGLGNVLVGGSGSDVLRPSSALDVVVDDAEQDRPPNRPPPPEGRLLVSRPTARVSVPGHARKVIVYIRQRHKRPRWARICIYPFRGAADLEAFSAVVRTRTPWPVESHKLSPLAETASARRGRCSR